MKINRVQKTGPGRTTKRKKESLDASLRNEITGNALILLPLKMGYDLFSVFFFFFFPFLFVSTVDLFVDNLEITSRVKILLIYTNKLSE